MNSSGIRDTARVLRISPTTVIKMIKKSPHLKAINEKVLAQIQTTHHCHALSVGEDRGRDG
jgi:insertion element IS1 protein InsB